MLHRLFFISTVIALLSACSSTPPAPSPSLPPSTLNKPLPRIALALGGGGARGFAHIGVIHALEANGIQIDMLTGTSAGSLVAALYASGMSGQALKQLAQKMDEAEIADWALPFNSEFGGVIRGEALQKYVHKLLNGRTIEQLQKPLGIVATELNSGKGVLFRYGDTSQAVRASSSIPGVFQPTFIAGKAYVDGGLVAPVPVRFARDMGATFVIAVNISAEASMLQPVRGLTGAVLKSTAIMGQTINQYELAQADIVIRPYLETMSSSDFQQRNMAIAAGEKAMLEKLPELLEKLNKNKK